MWLMSNVHKCSKRCLIRTFDTDCLYLVRWVYGEVDECERKDSMGVQVVEEVLDVDFDTGCLYLVRWYIYMKKWMNVREEIQQACPLPLLLPYQKKFSLTHSIPSLYLYSLIYPLKSQKNSLSREIFLGSETRSSRFPSPHTEPARWPFGINRPFLQYFLNHDKDIYSNLLAELRSSRNKCIHMCKSRILMGEKRGVSWH